MDTMNLKIWKSSFFLFLTAAIWGFAFAAQSVGNEYVGPFTFNAVRSFIGGVVLLPCILFLNVTKKNRERTDRKNFLLGGCLCGGILFCASSLQQVGLKYTTVGKAGFITAMYILIVPILGIFMKKKVGVNIWISVLLAVSGLYLLCMKERFTVGEGDLLILFSAFLFSIHILVIDYFSPKVNGVFMSCIQFFVCGIFSSFCMIFFEKVNINEVLLARIPILYAGVLSCGVAYTLQIIGQKDVDPTVASMILSLESPVSLLAGFLILGQVLSWKEGVGCALMMAGIILAQIPDRKKSII